MTYRSFLAAFAALTAVTGTTLAQTAPSSRGTPSINAGSGNTGSNRSGALGLSSKDRPKGASTEITCLQEATFDNASGVATFTGRVVVKDPQFTLYCQDLRVLLNKDRKGIERVDANGKVIIIQESVNEKGETVKSTGRGEKAVYEPASGNITLLVWPQIQQGINNHIAVEEGTVMVLNREGRLDTRGASKTTIVDSDNQGILP